MSEWKRRLKYHLAWIAFAAFGGACAQGVPEGDSASVVPASAPLDSGFAAVADSAWVDVKGPTLIGFYPIATNEELERNADLATVLDDFSYHIGTAMDSLIAAGVTVHYRGGDTLWLRAGNERRRLVRAADSSDVGYVLTDTTGTPAIIYGVRTYVDLIEYVREFKRTGTLRPR